MFNLPQGIDDFLGDAVGEEFVLRVHAQVGERQYGNGLFGSRRRGHKATGTRRYFKPQPVESVAQLSRREVTPVRIFGETALEDSLEGCGQVGPVLADLLGRIAQNR